MNRITPAVAILCATASASAGLQMFGHAERDAWFDSVTNLTKIDFVLEHGTHITDQYADLGVIFTDEFNFIGESSGTFLRDDFGIVSNWPGQDGFHLEFDTQQLWLASDHPGPIEYVLSLNGLAVGTGTFYQSGLDQFAGVISDQPFDAVIIRDPTGSDVLMDDLYFGVPAPGAGVVLLMGLAVGSNRRRPSA